jgi:hypothetical protein
MKREVSVWDSKVGERGMMWRRGQNLPLLALGEH